MPTLLRSVALAMLLVLPACGPGMPTAATDGTTPAPLSTASGQIAGSDTPQTSTSVPAAPRPTTSPIAVSGSFEDDVMGHEVQVHQLLRNFPFPESERFRADSSELVLVNMTATAGSSFSKLYLRDLELVTDKTETRHPGSTSYRDHLREAGYTPLDDIDRGRTGTGWVAFRVEPQNSENLTLRYARERFKVINQGGRVVPAKNFDIPLTQ